jgi:D-tyrosyl-tRNA(Tyr) deacylase
VRIVAQRVASGSVSWEDGGLENRATIGPGYVLLVGAAADDDESAVRRLADKVIDLRVFADEAGRMNLSLVDVHGAALIVSQFTLFADMSRGRRPSLLKAGDPKRAEELYGVFVKQFIERGIETQTGSFGAVMRVSIENDGPVTLVLSSDDWATHV